MFRPLAVLLNRSGLLPYLREQWRADDLSNRRDVKAYAARESRASAGAVRDEARASDAARRADATATSAAVDERLRELTQEVRQLRAVLSMNAERREARHRPALDVARAAAHVEQAVANAPLHTEPTAHIRVTDVLPPDTYSALLAAIPPDACFSQRDRTKQNFKRSDNGLAPDYTLEAWSFLEDRLIPGALVPALLRRFEPHIRQAYASKYGAHADAVAALPHRATAGRLMLRRPGYHLDPHLDPSRVIVTFLLHLAQPRDSEAFGTQFFRIDDTPAIDRTSTYYPGHHGHACELVTTVPFTPNTAVAFLNHGAAHGADIPASAPKGLKRYAYQVYVSPEPKAVAALLGEAVADDEE